MFSFRAMEFTLWIVVVSPHLVLSISVSEVPSFMMVAIQKVCQIVLIPLWIVLEPLTGKTMADVHTVGGQLFVQNHGTDSFSVFISIECGQASRPFIIWDTCVNIFKRYMPFIQQNAVPMLCWRSTN